jgi:hypothetical protein
MAQQPITSKEVPVKRRFTLLKNNSKVFNEVIELEKIKSGKFTFASQRMLDQLLEALEPGAVLITADPSDELAEPMSFLRSMKMIDFARWLRSRFDGGLRPAVDIMTKYFAWPHTREMDKINLEKAIINFTADYQNGTVARIMRGLEQFYSDHVMVQSEVNKQRIMKGE